MWSNMQYTVWKAVRVLYWWNWPPVVNNIEHWQKIVMIRIKSLCLSSMTMLLLGWHKPETEVQMSDVFIRDRHVRAMWRECCCKMSFRTWVTLPNWTQRMLCGVRGVHGSFPSLCRFFWDTGSCLTLLAGLWLHGWWIEVTVSCNCGNILSGNVLFNFGGLLKIHCSALLFVVTIDGWEAGSGSVHVKSGFKEPHMREAAHICNGVAGFLLRVFS